jgi:hypothetical protein
MAKRQPKKPHEMTTEEAVRHLFHPKAVEHLNNAVADATERAEKTRGKSIKGKDN